MIKEEKLLKVVCHKCGQEGLGGPYIYKKPYSLMNEAISGRPEYRLWLHCRNCGAETDQIGPFPSDNQNLEFLKKEVLRFNQIELLEFSNYLADLLREVEDLTR